MQGSVQRERPMGVTILAVLAIIAGILGLLGAVALLGLGGLAAASGVEGAGLAGGMAMLFGVVALVLAVLYLAFGFGAWTLKPWAWTLGVVSQVISLALNLLQIVMGSPIQNHILSIIIAAVILFYLFQPAVKAAFGRT